MGRILSSGWRIESEGFFDVCSWVSVQGIRSGYQWDLPGFIPSIGGSSDSRLGYEGLVVALGRRRALEDWDGHRHLLYGDDG